jgi:hypothetical protein
MYTKRFVITGLGIVLTCSPAWLHARTSPARPQDQPQDNVVEAARKAKAEKKTAPKAKLVIDNDNLDTLKGVVNVVGAEPAPPPAAADKTKAAAAPDDKTKPAAEKPEVKDESYWRKQFADANKKLNDDQHELDILQREYNLKEQQYYSDPNTAMKEQFDRKDLTDTKQKIDDKTTAVSDDKQAIADLDDELRKAGGDPGWERQP